MQCACFSNAFFVSLDTSVVTNAILLSIKILLYTWALCTNWLRVHSSCEASQENPRLLWNHTVHYRVQKSPPLVHCMSTRYFSLPFVKQFIHLVESVRVEVRDVRYDVCTEVRMLLMFWVLAQYRLVGRSRHFGGRCFPHLQGWNISCPSSRQKILSLSSAMKMEVAVFVRNFGICR